MVTNVVTVSMVPLLLVHSGAPCVVVYVVVKIGTLVVRVARVVERVHDIAPDLKSHADEEVVGYRMRMLTPVAANPTGNVLGYSVQEKVAVAFNA